MKKNLTILILSLCTLICFGEEKTIAQLVLEMNRSQRQGDYLEALVYATDILRKDPNHTIAKEFVHKNYERMDHQAKDRISEIAFSEDAAELEEMCEIYRKLSAINENLSEVEMPLKGGNKLIGEWVWQPEIQYYRGHYDRARSRVFNLYKQIGKAAVMENNIDDAYFYYEKALNTYLLSDEYEGQRDAVKDACREQAQIDSKSLKTDDLIRAYNTYGLIVRLDSTETQSLQEQQRLMPVIADSYVADAKKLVASELVTDWELAYDYCQTAMDWNDKKDFVASTTKYASLLAKRIADYYTEQGDPESAQRWQEK
ncbi:MAG: hypothetical protein IKN91_02085 [Paludibacteraceae bacterium]|nr:hypothetical protein [Paludibacteraceae bacterium]